MADGPTREASNYRGRFAPSPTGPLHMGSLLAATLSYLDAKANQGTWLVRIEDIDPLREAPGATAAILRSLDRHALHWDESVTLQSTLRDNHLHFLHRLRAANHVYHCPCSRKDRHALGGKHLAECGVHRQRDYADTPGALRFRLTTEAISFEDCIKGSVRCTLRPGIDDFIVWRKEGYPAYQLAVVADDSLQGITHVIRGLDLIASTPLQIALHTASGLHPPKFGHFFLLTDAKGSKLSKQNQAPALDDSQATVNLRRVLCAAGLRHPELDAATSPGQLLAAAQPLWNRALAVREPVCIDDHSSRSARQEV